MTWKKLQQRWHGHVKIFKGYRKFVLTPLLYLNFQLVFFAFYKKIGKCIQLFLKSRKTFENGSNFSSYYPWLIFREFSRQLAALHPGDISLLSFILLYTMNPTAFFPRTNKIQPTSQHTAARFAVINKNNPFSHNTVSKFNQTSVKFKVIHI